jgi:serine/threonine protein kinase
VDSAKLVDFGLARKLSPSQESFLNHGTPCFVSPEAVNVKPISTACDVWGVGVLAYIL